MRRTTKAAPGPGLPHRHLQPQGNSLQAGPFHRNHRRLDAISRHRCGGRRLGRWTRARFIELPLLRSKWTCRDSSAPALAIVITREIQLHQKTAARPPRPPLSARPWSIMWHPVCRTRLLKQRLRLTKRVRSPQRPIAIRRSSC